jgi:hypothetical protein
VVEGKGSHHRVVPVANRFFDTLGGYLHDEGPLAACTDRVFVVLKGPRRGLPLSAERFWTAPAAGLAWSTRPAMSLRHTLPDPAAGGALEAVQAQAWHRSIESTRVYLHLTNDWLVEQYRRAPALIDENGAAVAELLVAQRWPPGERRSHLGDDEHHFFAACERLSHRAEILRPDGAAPLYNPVIWIVSHERDLPTWMTAGNEAIRKIAVPLPDFGDRQVSAGELPEILPGYADAPEQARLGLQKRFAQQTQRLTVRAMVEITRLAVRQPTPLDEIDEAVRCYRVGVYDNPWRRPHLRDRLAEATSTIAAQVHGQPEAIQHSVDILVRSVLNLSGAHNSVHSRVGLGG